ncbi:MAG: PAS domain S-box protein [Desulforhopalus sp.]|nr:PAS domain S-box protein [Desulforhopalus sp.]
MSTKDNSQLNRFILDSIPVAIVTMDYDFKITSFNKRAEQLTGYLADEAVGRPCYEIVNGSRCGEDCPLQTVRNAGESPSGLEAEIVNRHGEHISIRIGAASILNEDKSFVGYLEVIEDISRQKRREREKNNFISTIAHDMKSPLVGISGLIKRLKKEQICETNEKLREYLRVMDEAEERLESMVNDFLEYSHLESGQIKLDLDEIDIQQILEQVAEMHQLRAEGKNIILSFDCHSLGAIEADANRLHRVFTNIVDNAIKYSPQQSEIAIRVSETDKEIVICFQDQGWGINPEQMPYIFDAFYRAESEEEVNGHGLGLAASRAIIRQHGGRISVESRPGKGSVFTVRLPKQKT